MDTTETRNKSSAHAAIMVAHLIREFRKEILRQHCISLDRYWQRNSLIRIRLWRIHRTIVIVPLYLRLLNSQNIQQTDSHWTWILTPSCLTRSSSWDTLVSSTVFFLVFPLRPRGWRARWTVVQFVPACLQAEHGEPLSHFVLRWRHSSQLSFTIKGFIVVFFKIRHEYLER